jgi:hypothetical protein
MIGPRQITSHALRALSLDPQRAAANAAPSAQQRRRDRADQLAAIKRRYGAPARPLETPQDRDSRTSRQIGPA